MTDFPVPARVAAMDHPVPCQRIDVGPNSLGRAVFVPVLRCFIAARIAEDDNGCWLWTGSRTTTGYGIVHHRHAPTRLAHRTVYLLLVGPIPDGLQLDHLCRVRHCVRPDHLEPVTPQQNSKRGIRSRLGSRCSRGHEDWRVAPNGHRHCRKCEHDMRVTRRAGR